MIEPLTDAVHMAIAGHLELIAPLLCENFGAIPLVYATYPRGLDARPVYHEHLENGPATIPVVHARTSTGEHAFVELSVHNVVWLARGRFAVELQSWSPTARDPLCAAFGRITLEPSGKTAFAKVVAAARALRTALLSHRLEAIVLFDGVRGIDLWIPFNDAPQYDALAAWLRSFVNSAASMHPELFTVEHLRAKRGSRVYLSVRTNYPGMGTVLPYQVRGVSGLPLVTPVAWNDLDAVRNGDLRVENFQEWLAKHGDLFAALRAGIAPQRLPLSGPDAPDGAEDRRAAVFLQSVGLTGEPTMQPPNPILQAVLQILADGKARSADEIYAKGTALGILQSTTRKHLYTDIYEYIARTLGTGRAPEIVQDPATKAFRLNRPEDIWPQVALTPLPGFIDSSEIERLVKTLADTSRGDDPAAFEVAVCDAFRALGFFAAHIGGTGAPDGTLDAPLGVDAYRIILECKTAPAANVVSNPRPEEPDGFRAAYHGTFALLIGPAFASDATLDAELQTHGVSLWTVDDLCAMLRAQVGPAEILPALAGGRAKVRCDLLLWERDHGRRKRIAVIAQTLLQAGWTAQCALLNIEQQADQPPFTYDSLTFVVDTTLAEEGLPPADPVELQAALDGLLADGRVARAKSNGNAFIVTRPPGEKT